MKKSPWVLIAVVVVLVLAVGGWYYAKNGNPVTNQPVGQPSVNDNLGSTNVVGAGEHCGGNIANPPSCGTGYHCAPSPGSHLPFGDVGGICVVN